MAEEEEEAREEENGGPKREVPALQATIVSGDVPIPSRAPVAAEGTALREDVDNLSIVAAATTTEDQAAAENPTTTPTGPGVRPCQWS